VQQPKRAARIFLLSITLLAVASLATLPVRSDKAGLPLFAGAQIDPDVLAIMQRSCQDCHSEATHYPWYAYVAPSSWVIKSDVNEGRRHLNLSCWNEYPLVRKERSLSEIANQVKDHEMPLWQYTMLHPSARLSESDVMALFRWTQAERSRLIAESQR
jgi:hypothetical protein